MIDLPRAWLSPGGKAMPWATDEPGMYEYIPFEKLPPLPLGDGSFGWLPPLDPDIEGMDSGMWELEGEAAVRDHLADLDRRARALGSAVPPEFVRFMTTKSLFERVPSCTGCYFDLRGSTEEGSPAKLYEIPGDTSNARLLLFMTELSRGWYLVLDGTTPPLVATAWDDPDNDYQITELQICAESFESFIHRFWIENMLWFHYDRGTAPEGELRTYLDEAKARVSR